MEVGMDKAKAEAYWKANISLIRNLLIVWALVSYGFGILLVQPLNNIKLGAVPLGFWFAHQGSIIIFVILIFIYVSQMNKIDQQFDVHE
jgi:putative solute:sodium symporter small subunit